MFKITSFFVMHSNNVISPQKAGETLTFGILGRFWEPAMAISFKLLRKNKQIPQLIKKFINLYEFS